MDFYRVSGEIFEVSVIWGLEITSIDIRVPKKENLPWVQNNSNPPIRI